ncbi:MAG: SCO family protein [Crocinitomix sp.]|nr:SCO family protein [Crocinitomix sp.]
MIGKNSFFVLLAFAFCACTTDNAVEASIVPITVDALPYYHTPNFDPIWEVGDLDTLHTIADFSFTDQNGLSVTEETIADKIYISNFFFTNCGGICPKLTRNMEIVQGAFEAEEDVLFLSHSVAPEIDSVPKLKAYTNNFNVNDARWHFLTGSKTEIYEMARQSYFAEEVPGFNKDSTEFLHTEHFILVDRDKHIRGIYNGTVELEMDRIIEDINLLLNE